MLDLNESGIEEGGWAGDVVYLDNCDDVHLYDTSEPEYGAPGTPGEFRWCKVELDSGVKVLQLRQLFLVDMASGTPVPKGSVLEKAVSTYSTADALAPADSILPQLAGVVPAGINRNKLGGQAQGTLPASATTAYWAWLVVRGPTDILSDAAVANEGVLVVKAASAAGRVDDAGASGLEASVLGRALEAAGGAGTLFEADVTIR